MKLENRVFSDIQPLQPRPPWVWTPTRDTSGRIARGAKSGWALWLCGLAFASSPLVPAWAADVDRAAIAATYAQDRAACSDGSNQQERGTCLREAAASRDQALRGALPTASPQTLRDNALRRCMAQPVGEARSLCERMAAGEGRSTGSVAAGGMLQELTTVVKEPKAPLKP